MSTLPKIAIGVLVVFVVAFVFIWFLTTESERYLRPVKTGMTQGQVRSVVGSPLSIINRTNGTDAWYYSRWWMGDAVVYFDTNQLVSAKETD